MIGAIHTDLLSRPAKGAATWAEMRERERQREAVRALLRDIARPAGAAGERRAA